MRLMASSGIKRLSLGLRRAEMLLGFFRPLRQGVSNASRGKRIDRMSDPLVHRRNSLPGRKIRNVPERSEAGMQGTVQSSLGSTGNYFAVLVELARAWRRPWLRLA